MRSSAFLLLSFALALNLSVLGADSVYRGSLLVVMPGSLSVRVPDGSVISFRLPKSGKLSAESVAKELKLGDQVEITAKRIDPSLNSQRDLYLFLELKAYRFIEPASAEELSKVAAALSWQPADNFLKVSSALKRTAIAVNGDPVLDRIRQVNLDSASNMPNFIADEIAKRSTGRRESSDWKMQDTVVSEIAFKGNEAVRQNIRINGKRFTSKSSWLPGVTWDVAFGSELKALFDRDCGNVIESRETFRYEFRSPPDGCFSAFTVGYAQFNPANTGEVLIDGSSGRVLHFRKVTAGFPPEFVQVEAKDEIFWESVKIGDSSWLVPVSADYLYTFKSGDVWHIEVQFKNHRHFETSIKLQVQ
jgi:hypothetical protein